MNVEQQLRELEEIKRPFSRSFRAIEDNAYLIDNTFAFRRIAGSYRRKHVVFVADKQLPILTEHAKEDRELHGIGIGTLVLAFYSDQRVAYLGDRYKFSLSEDLRYFQLQSTNPINSEPVPKNKDLKALVAQRTSSTKI